MINNWLPDLEGTNTPHPGSGPCHCPGGNRSDAVARSETYFRQTLGTSRTDTLIPGLAARHRRRREVNAALLQKGVRAYNKTGDIGIAYVDSALLELPDGRRVVASYMVEGPFNDPQHQHDSCFGCCFRCRFEVMRRFVLPLLLGSAVLLSPIASRSARRANPAGRPGLPLPGQLNPS